MESSKPFEIKEERVLLVENSLIPGIQTGIVNVGLNIKDRMRHHNVPGVSMVIINDGKPISSMSYGVMETKASDELKLTPQTIFQAGSISKVITAIIALKLVEEGVLNLDEDINVKLKKSGLSIPESEFTKIEKITLRRLLSHTAGLTVHGFDGYPSSTEEKNIPTLQQILKGEQPANSAPVEVDTVPGKNCRYSGGGTEFVQLLVEQVTGKKYAELADEIIFKPLKMSSATLELIRPGSSRPTAKGHGFDGVPVTGGWNLFPESAAAGLWATPSDIATLVSEIQNIFNGVKSKGILSQEMVKEMLTLQQNSTYGLGPVLGKDEFSHEGSTEGYESYFVGFSRAPGIQGSGQGVVIMTNSANGTKLIPEIARGVAKVFNWPETYSLNKIKKPVPIDVAIYKNYEGSYKFDLKEGKSINIKILAEHDKLFIITPLTPTGEPKKIELIPQSPTHFITEDFEVHFTDKNEFSIFNGKARRVAPSSTAEDVPLSGTAKTATLLGVPPSKLMPGDHVSDKKVESSEPTKSESWWQQELTEKRELLKAFWDNNIVKPNDKVVEKFKIWIINIHFPKDLAWEQKLENAIKNKNNFEDFFDVLKHCSLRSIRAIGFFDPTIKQKDRQVAEHKSEFEEKDFLDISKYMSEKRMSASISFSGANGQLVTPNLSELQSCSFSMHSVGKIYTGMLAMVMIREGVITDDDLKKPPVKLDESVVSMLPATVRAQLKKVSLHQLMTHEAGLGDYNSKYFQAISEQKGMLEMKQVEEFLPFCESSYYLKAVTTMPDDSKIEPNGYFLIKNYDNWNLIYIDQDNNKHQINIDEIVGLRDALKTLPNKSVSALSENDLSVPYNLLNQHFCDNQIGKFRYSNVGILLAGLAIKHAYEKKYPERAPCDYNQILQQHLIDKVSKPNSFSPFPPKENAKFNKDHPLAAQIVGSPAGCYWTTAEDLAKFGKWIYEQCNTDPRLEKLMKIYGKEFYNPETRTVFHGGNIESASAYLSVSLETGAIVATLSNQPDMAYDLAYKVQENGVLRPLKVSEEDMSVSRQFRSI